MKTIPLPILLFLFFHLFSSCSKTSQIDEKNLHEDLYNNILVLDSISTDRDVDINGDGKTKSIVGEIPEIKKAALVLKKTNSNIYFNLLWIEPMIEGHLLKNTIEEIKDKDSPLPYKIVQIDFIGKESEENIKLISYVNSGYQYTYQVPYRVEVKKQMIIVFSKQDFLVNGKILTLTIEAYFKRKDRV